MVKDLEEYNKRRLRCCRCLYWCLHLWVFSGLIVYFFYCIHSHDDFQDL